MTTRKELKVGDKVKYYGLDFKPLSWWECCYIKPTWVWRDFSYWCKKMYQRIRYGFPLEEAWDFKSYCAKWILPRLKHLRDSRMGYPSILSDGDYEKGEEETGDAKWTEILNKMIWSFEHMNDDIEPIYPENYDDRQIVVEVSDRGTTFKPVDERPIDWSPILEHQKRLQEGFDLFGKYFQDLWD